MHLTTRASRPALATTVALLAFAGNSLLCRAALTQTRIDALSFSTLRVLSGTAMLWLLIKMQRSRRVAGGNWKAASALVFYLLAFSIAYTHLQAGVGALLLFGTVQLSMLAAGRRLGERLAPLARGGCLLAMAGLILLLLPGASAPALPYSLCMLVSGVAWGVYSLIGKQARDPLAETAGNFARAALLMTLLTILGAGFLKWDAVGAFYAVVAGTFTSAVGYAIWYGVLPELQASQAGTVQLGVPILTAAASFVFLGEALTMRQMLASLIVLLGIATVFRAGAGRS